MRKRLRILLTTRTQQMKTHTYQIYVNGRLAHTNRSGKVAFKNFESYKIGERFNYPDPDGIVRQVQLIRDDGMIQDKGAEAQEASK